MCERQTFGVSPLFRLNLIDLFHAQFVNALINEPMIDINQVNSVLYINIPAGIATGDIARGIACRPNLRAVYYARSVTRGHKYLVSNGKLMNNKYGIKSAMAFQHI